MKLEPCYRASCMQIIDALKAELGDLPQSQAEMLAQIKADEALMRGILERMERYQTKRGDYETFEAQAMALTARLEQT
jgi:hypothetical protein